MKTRTFHDVSERYTIEGNGIQTAFVDALRPVFQHAVEEGFAIRDLELLMYHAAVDVAIDAILDLKTFKEN